MLLAALVCQPALGTEPGTVASSPGGTNSRSVSGEPLVAHLTEGIRYYEVVIAPGLEAVWEADRVPYFLRLAEGTLEITFADGSKKRFQAADRLPPHTHWRRGRNVGNTPVRLVALLELPANPPEWLKPPGSP